MQSQFKFLEYFSLNFEIRNFILIYFSSFLVFKEKKVEFNHSNSNKHDKALCCKKKLDYLNKDLRNSNTEISLYIYIFFF